MAEGRTPKSHFTRVTKTDKDLRKAVLKLLMAVRDVRKDDVTITYPSNKEDDLVVVINEEVFYSERLPDTVVREQCKIRGIKEKSGKTELKILLVKEHQGAWKNKWCMEKQS